MLKKVWNYFSEKKPSEYANCTYHPHQMKASSEYNHAIEVIDGLRQKGHQAYLVGGCVRDSLLGLKPKDFDVATSATPEQVCKLFKRARIIGRRFRIVHVRFGRYIVEVTTFRGNHDNLKTARKKVRHDKNMSTQSASGLLTRDNVYGTIEDDAKRRDFTANCLYYDHQQQAVLDFCHGVKDIQQGKLEVIGDVEQRFREDPVRMIRAIRFSIRLKLAINDETIALIKQHAQLLQQVSPARLFDEVLKLMMNGKAKATFSALQRYQLMAFLFPATQPLLQSNSQTQSKSQTEFYQHLIKSGLHNTDKRIANHQRVTPAFLFAFTLWPVFDQEMQRQNKQFKHKPLSQRFDNAWRGAIEQQAVAVTIPKHFSQAIREIWGLQNRLCHPAEKNIAKTFEHKRFRAAYDFLLLREQAGEQHNQMGQWWTDFQKLNDQQREKEIKAIGQLSLKQAKSAQDKK